MTDLKKLKICVLQETRIHFSSRVKHLNSWQKSNKLKRHLKSEKVPMNARDLKELLSMLVTSKNNRLAS